MREGVDYTVCSGPACAALLSKNRSAAWHLFALDSPDNDGGDLKGLCLLCAGPGASTTLFMAKGSISHAVKHVETTSNSSVPPARALMHTRAAQYICRSPTVGARGKRVVDGRITRFLKTDARPHHMR